MLRTFPVLALWGLGGAESCGLSFIWHPEVMRAEVKSRRSESGVSGKNIGVYNDVRRDFRKAFEELYPEQQKFYEDQAKEK